MPNTPESTSRGGFDNGSYDYRYCQCRYPSRILRYHGTLTSFTTHTVPDSTIEAIHRLQAAGVKVLICTGRAPSQMHVVLDTMPVTFDGVVAFNGQYCFDDTGFFASQALDTADIEVILDWLDRHPRCGVQFRREGLRVLQPVQ